VEGKDFFKTFYTPRGSPVFFLKGGRKKDKGGGGGAANSMANLGAGENLDWKKKILGGGGGQTLATKKNPGLCRGGPAVYSFFLARKPGARLKGGGGGGKTKWLACPFVFFQRGKEGNGEKEKLFFPTPWFKGGPAGGAPQ